MLKAILGAAVGGAIGFALASLGRCSTGACPLTSNPWTATIVFGLMGLMIGLGAGAGK